MKSMHLLDEKSYWNLSKEGSYFIVGYLNPSSDDQNLLRGTKIELPFWLAHKLRNDSKQILSVTVPKVYRESYRDMYRADANVVDLQAIGPNFYNLAMKMPLIDPAQARDISASALQVSRCYIMTANKLMFKGNQYSLFFPALSRKISKYHGLCSECYVQRKESLYC